MFRIFICLGKPQIFLLQHIYLPEQFPQLPAERHSSRAAKLTERQQNNYGNNYADYWLTDEFLKAVLLTPS